MEAKLKPCPFCGSPAEVYATIEMGWFAGCTNEECIGMIDSWACEGYNSKSIAIEEWNKRAKQEITIVEFRDNNYNWSFYTATTQSPEQAMRTYLKEIYGEDDIPEADLQLDDIFYYWNSEREDVRAYKVELES